MTPWRFQTAIGVPEEVVAGMRRSPGWPALVVDSTGSDARLRAWADGVAPEVPAPVVADYFEGIE